MTQREQWQHAIETYRMFCAKHPHLQRWQALHEMRDMGILPAEVVKQILVQLQAPIPGKEKMPKLMRTSQQGRLMRYYNDKNSPLTNKERRKLRAFIKRSPTAQEAEAMLLALRERMIKVGLYKRESGRERSQKVQDEKKCWY